jgi:ankyrin repeat protein
VISAKGKRVEGTCEWIRGHKSYHAWLNGDISLLWISGGPGKGKTMMSIFLTEHLEQKIPTMENTQLVYFFFSFQDRNRNTGVILLQSLIYQIVTKRPQLKTYLLPYINFQRSEPSLEPLWAILKKLIQDPELGTMLCVIDGLDESDKEATEILLPRLVDLLSPALQSPLSTTFKLIVVSRDIFGLEDCTRIKLDPDNNNNVNDDIEKFISTRVSDLSKVVGSRHGCEIEVQTTLLKRAEGTFLWVGFAMYELMRKRTWTQVFDALKTLPSGLPALYSRMLHQIPAERRQTSSRILQWVTMSFRPLKLLQIAAAIGLETLYPSISLEHAMMDEITLCGSFLKVQGPEVTLIHQSVRDYILDGKSQNDPVLEAFRIKPNEAHFKMAQTCLQYIEQSSLQERPLEFDVQPGEPPFLRYAVLHWLKHAAFCSNLAAELFDSAQSFFTITGPLRDNWWEIYGRRDTLEWMFLKKPPPLLHIACRLGIVPWVMIMVHGNSPTGSKPDKILSPSVVNQRDVTGNTALHYAAFAGNNLLVQLLFQNGANVSANKTGRTALHFAAKSGKESTKIVQLLLDQGAEIDAPDDFGRTALHETVRNGKLQILGTLLDRGASLERTDFGGITALHIAVENKDVSTVRLLLDRGANPEAADLWGRRALYKAARKGDVDKVQLLLERGADIQAKTFEGGTALHSATEYQLEDTHRRISGMKKSGVVQLLLDRGADKNARNREGKTAFDDPRFIEFLESLDEAVERPQKRSRRE